MSIESVPNKKVV